MDDARRRPKGPNSPLVLILFLMALFVGLWAWTSGSPASKVTLTPPWTPGEISRLEVRQRGASVSSWEMRVDAGAGADVSVISSDIRTSDGGYHEQAQVSVNSATLAPSRTEFSLASRQGNASFSAEYAEDEVRIRAENPSGPAEASVKLPAPPYFDNESFVMVIRALPLRTRLRASLNDIITRTGSKTMITCQVVGSETITVPAGTFDTWKVELKGTGQTAWIAKSPRRQLVKYENAKTETVSQLLEYIPGE